MYPERMLTSSSRPLGNVVNNSTLQLLYSSIQEIMHLDCLQFISRNSWCNKFETKL